MGMTVMDIEVYTHRSLKTGSTHAMQGHAVKHQGWSGGRGSGGNTAHSCYWGFPGKELVRWLRYAE